MGTFVTLQDLKGAPQHNGKKGKVLAWIPEKNRYNIQLTGEEAAGSGSAPGIGRLLFRVKERTEAEAGLAVRPINLQVDNLVAVGEQSRLSANANAGGGGQGSGGDSPYVTKEWIKKNVKPWLLKEDGLYLALLDKSIVKDGGERSVLFAAGMDKDLALSPGTKNMLASAAAAAASGKEPGALVEKQRAQFYVIMLTDSRGCQELTHHTMTVRTNPLMARGASGDRFKVECPDLERALGTGFAALASDQL